MRKYGKHGNDITGVLKGRIINLEFFHSEKISCEMMSFLERQKPK